MFLSPHLHVSRSVNYPPCMHKTELWIALAYIIHFAIYLLSLADSNILILHYYYTSDICLLIRKLFLSALSFMLIFKWNALHGTILTWVLYFAYHAKLVMSLCFCDSRVSQVGTMAFAGEITSLRKMQLMKWRAGALKLGTGVRPRELL